MHEELQIIYKSDGTPSGIRDRSGFLLFFPDVHRYQGQDERYKDEAAFQHALAKRILKELR